MFGKNIYVQIYVCLECESIYIYEYYLRISQMLVYS